MSVIWKKGSPAAFLNMGNTIMDQLYKQLANAMVGIAEQAALTARAYTAQRGRPSSRGSGRIDSGAMAEAIDSEVETKAREIIGRYGFTDEKLEYFVLQTVTGFRHYLSSEFIEPTFALRDAKLRAEGDIYRAIEAAIRSVKL